jgi:AraC-like DNA-binding protein
MARLRALRLEMARSELARAARNGRTVASVANELGFGHLGRFSADYRARFSESPSDTLRHRGVWRLPCHAGLRPQGLVAPSTAPAAVLFKETGTP